MPSRFARPKSQTVTVSLYITPELRGMIDEARGLVPISTWIKDVISKELAKQAEGDSAKMVFGRRI